ncbi:MAG TPA: STAS domain-containing protein [Micromonosporaceae bacterium]|nr:STAS domain-containing protein [Micromonosporaceae bacterium]
MTESPQLSIDVTCPSLDTARAAVVGEVDLATAQILRESLLDVLREHPPAVLTVDLSGVTFLDCAGISALVAAHNAAVAGGCQLSVTGSRPIVRQLLDLTGLLGILSAPTDQAQRPVLNVENPSTVGSIRNPQPSPAESLVAA